MLTVSIRMNDRDEHWDARVPCSSLAEFARVCEERKFVVVEWLIDGIEEESVADVMIDVSRIRTVVEL